MTKSVSEMTDEELIVVLSESERKMTENERTKFWEQHQSEVAELRQQWNGWGVEKQVASRRGSHDFCG